MSKYIVRSSIDWLHREVTEEYKKEIVKVTERLLETLSEGLHLEGKALKSCMGGNDIKLEMKINMYPLCP